MKLSWVYYARGQCSNGPGWGPLPDRYAPGLNLSLGGPGHILAKQNKIEQTTKGKNIVHDKGLKKYSDCVLLFQIVFR